MSGQVANNPYSNFDNERLDVSGYGINEAASFYSEKVDQNRSGYLHPMMSANGAQIMALFGVLASIFVLVSFILSWIMTARSSSNLLLWFTIALGVIFFVGLAIAGLAFSIKGNLVADKPENKLFSACAYLGAVLSGAFLLMTVLVLLFHRYVQFNNLLGVYDDPNKFKEKYSFNTFEDAWKSDRRMIWWIAFFNLLAAISFGVAGFLMWSISKFMIQLGRALLSMAGGIAILFFMLAMYQAEKALNANLQHSSTTDFYSSSEWSAIWWILLVTVILLVINLIFNIVKKRIVYFFLGIILLVIFIILAIKIGYNLRSFRKGIEPGQANTDSALQKLSTIHENDIKDVCGKYSPLGTSCGKKYDVVWVEGNMNKRSLSPSCARNAVIFMHQPMYWCGIFTLFGLIYLFIVIGCDFYLSDVTEFLETFNRETSIFDYIGLGLGILAFAIILIWLLAASFSKFNQLKTSTYDIYDKLQAGTYVDPDYTIVPKKVLQLDRNINNVCVPYSSDKMVSVQTNPACTKKVCGYRVAILAESVQISGISADKLGNYNLRGIIFPTARNTQDGFIVFKGTASEIASILSSLQFCAIRYNEDLSIFYNIEEVDLTEMNADSTKKNEVVTTFSTTPDGDRGFPTTYSYGSNMICKSSAGCQYENRIPRSTGIVSISANIFGKNTKGVYELASEAMAKTIKVEAYHGRELYATIPAGSIVGGGLFEIEVPSSTNTPYALDLKITDTNGKYKSYLKQVTVPAIDGERKSLGKIPLILPSGNGCLGDADFSGCLDKNQNPGRGVIVITVINSDTNTPIPNAEFTIVRGHVLGISNPVYSGRTDGSGVATVNDMTYDYYTIHSIAPNFVSGVSEFTLESPKAERSIFLVTNSLTAMDVNLLIENADNFDTDLKVRIRNENGKECLVSAENKYCAYSYYLFDVLGGKTGMETVRIHQMSISTYMVYTESIPENKGYCPSIQAANTHFAQKPQQIDWKTVKTVDSKAAKHLQNPTPAPAAPAVASPPSQDNYRFWVAYCFTGFGQMSIKTVNKKYETDPGASICLPLYPDSDKYSIKNLRAKVDEANRT